MSAAIEPRNVTEMQDRFRASRDRMESAGKAFQANRRVEMELRAELAQVKSDFAAIERENLALTAALSMARSAASLPPAVINKVEPFITIVSDITGFSRAHLKSDRREISVVKARAIVFWLSKRFGELSLPVIGHRVGGKDHTTVLHGCRKVDRIIERLKLKPENDTPDCWAELLWGRKWPKHGELASSSPSASLGRT